MKTLQGKNTKMKYYTKNAYGLKDSIEMYRTIKGEKYIHYMVDQIDDPVTGDTFISKIRNENPDKKFRKINNDIFVMVTN